MPSPGVRCFHDPNGQSHVVDDGKTVATFKSPWSDLNRDEAHAFKERYKARLHPPAAIQGVFDVMSEWMAMPFPSMTCSEAERLADLARAWGRHEFAEHFLYAHSSTDEDFTDLHHGMTEPPARTT